MERRESNEHSFSTGLIISSLKYNCNSWGDFHGDVQDKKGNSNQQYYNFMQKVQNKVHKDYQSKKETYWYS